MVEHDLDLDAGKVHPDALVHTAPERLEGVAVDLVLPAVGGEALGIEDFRFEQMRSAMSMAGGALTDPAGPTAVVPEVERILDAAWNLFSEVGIRRTIDRRYRTSGRH